MRSDVVITATAHRAPRIECTGGVAARRTGPDTVHLVSAAATPIGGDSITVRVVVEPGARLALRTVAASVVLPGPQSAVSHTVWELDVAGELDLDPEPTVVAGGSTHLAVTRLRLQRSGAVRLRERVQIGRCGERHGFWSGTLHADVGDRPLLRHRTELGTGSIGADALGTPLACVSELRYPEPSFDGQGTVMTLADGGALATWQGARL